MNTSGIVVTGIGLTTPLGATREESWDRIKRGESLTSVPETRSYDGPFESFARLSPMINPNGLHRIFPLALSAARESLADSGIDPGSLDPERAGCSVSVSKPIIGGPFLSVCPGEAVGMFLRREIGIAGPFSNVIAACATGLHSILTASRWLKEGLCDVAIAGSVESSLHPLILSGFYRMGVLSHEPCPFDKRRKGFMIGEGAGILVLERSEDAHARRARIHSQVLACAIGSDFNHPTSFDPEGSSVASVLQRALSQSDVTTQDIDYINLHGTGTPDNDLIETRAIKKVFAKRSYKISLSSTKASTGHLLGAAGSVEAGLACLALRDGFVPPTVHLEADDPECDLDYTPVKGKKRRIDVAASLSFGFGGPIGAVVFRKGG